MSRDGQVTDITVILKKQFEDRFAEALEMLKAAGLAITGHDENESVIDGSVSCEQLAIIETAECVEYVRRIMTYSVDYPAGDPRDKNGCIDCECEDEEATIRRRMGKSYP